MAYHLKGTNSKRIKKIFAAIALLSHNPLVVSLFTMTVGGYGLFLFQTNAENQRQLRQTRVEALREISDLHGEMQSNLSHLARVRCELIRGLLSKSELNQRSIDMQERLNRTREKSDALIFRVEMLFSPSQPWYKSLLGKLWADHYVAPRTKTAESVLDVYQEMTHLYAENAAVAMARVWKIPAGITCDSDDNSYLEKYQIQSQFKLARLYNMIAPMIGMKGLSLEIRKEPPVENVQIFTSKVNGKDVKLACKITSESGSSCTIVK